MQRTAIALVVGLGVALIALTFAPIGRSTPPHAASTFRVTPPDHLNALASGDVLAGPGYVHLPSPGVGVQDNVYRHDSSVPDTNVVLSVSNFGTGNLHFKLAGTLILTVTPDVSTATSIRVQGGQQISFETSTEGSAHFAWVVRPTP